MKSVRKLFFVVACVFLGFGRTVVAQEGEAGVESIFSIGVGARALGLGGAGVAFPDDPSAFFWNPGGMVVVQQKEIALSLTTLFEGTQYNFMGYVHPTLTSGTFGLGIARIGTGGIKHIEDEQGVPVEIGELNYWSGKLFLSYAMTLFKGLAMGMNFHATRQVLGFYSTNGFGIDVGIHYGFQQEEGILKDLFLGCSMFNVVSPRLKMNVASEMVPYSLRAGFGKLFFLRQNADRWLFLADLEQAEYKRLKYHIGTEYSWNRLLFLRMGVDNGSMAFGGGLRYKNFQIDYGTSRIGDPGFFPRSHRFSIIFYIGKNLPEQRRQLEEQKVQEIQRRFSERMETERQRRIQEGLKAGTEYLQKGDYFNARLEFSRVLTEDKENREAQQKLAETTEKEQAMQQERQANLLREDRERERSQRDNTFVNQRFTEGLEALQDADFRKAIEKWEQALQRDPNNLQIIGYIQRAKVELENEVNKLIAKAQQLVRQENLSEAYKVLGRAKEQTEGNPELQQKVLREIQSLDRTVDFLTNYQEGVQRYGKGEYEAAARFFQKALQYDPNHSRAREFLRNSLARSGGEKKEMTGEVKEKFYQGIQLYSDGKYEEALTVWEEALELDPQNIKLLEAIEGARKKLETYKKKP